jgi:hypothetical protein
MYPGRRRSDHRQWRLLVHLPVPRSACNSSSSWRTGPKATALIVTCLFLGTAMSGCASGREGATPTNRGLETMNATEARNEVRSLYALTKSLVGPCWTEVTRTWAQCATASGEAGVNYTLLAHRARIALADKPEVIAEQARTMWAEHGHVVKIVFGYQQVCHRRRGRARFSRGRPVPRGGGAIDALLPAIRSARSTYSACRMFDSCRTRVAAGVALALVGAALSGCVHESDRPSTSPTVSRDRMLAFVDRTADELATTDWREASGANLQGCRVEGRDGVNYTHTRLGPASTDLSVTRPL